MDIVVGTAGHIDHGKTALVKALTGVDADRLPEERQRGITIDLGFADLELDGVHIGFVDVPGHERFVKNMLAGAGGIDAVMLVIAADEGVMPQTREHFQICRLLDTRQGLIVLTKSDLVDQEFLDLVELDAAELVEGTFLEDAPVIRTSSKTGAGLAELKEALREVAARVPERKGDFVTRLPVDRSFSVKGFGAVVTGTLAAGEIRTGLDLDLLPAGKRVRVRGIQTHGKQVDRAGAGRRTAVNLGGIDHSAVSRGMMLTEPDSLSPTQIIDAEVEVLEDARQELKSRQRVRVHIGTMEALARIDVLNAERSVGRGETDFVQIRLEVPVAAIPSERFIIRRYSPQITIAGGRVLDNSAERHRRKDLDAVRNLLSDLVAAVGDPGELVRVKVMSAGIRGLSVSDLRKQTGLRPEITESEVSKLISSETAVKADDLLVPADAYRELTERIVTLLKDHHAKDPLSAGMPRETLREKAAAHIPSEIFRSALEALESEGSTVSDKETVRLGSHTRELGGDAGKVFDELKRIYSGAGLQVPGLDDALSEAVRGTRVSKQEARKIFQIAVDSAEILKVSDEFYFSRDSIGGLIDRLKEFAEGSEDRLIGVPEFKELAGISRKYAIPLLEYLDAVKVTRRAGDKRLIL